MVLHCWWMASSSLRLPFDQQPWSGKNCRRCFFVLIFMNTIFVFYHMSIFWRVDWRCAKQNEVYSCILVLLHGKELWQMVRVGGGEVKSKAKRKKEHDEAEQEQLGKLRLRDVLWRIKSNNSIDKRQYPDRQDTRIAPSMPTLRKKKKPMKAKSKMQ